MFVLLTANRGVAAAFHTQAEALTTIYQAFDAHGRDYAGRYSLVHEDGHGGSTPVAAGAELVELAIQSAREKI